MAIGSGMGSTVAEKTRAQSTLSRMQECLGLAEEVRSKAGYLADKFSGPMNTTEKAEAPPKDAESNGFWADLNEEITQIIAVLNTTRTSLDAIE